jgi:hypothetical protein
MSVNLPTVHLQQLVSATDIESVDLLDIPYEDGALPDSDAKALLAILVARNPQTILEIGTYHGATTARMAHQLPKARIHTIDLFPGTRHQPEFSDPHLIASRHVVGRHFIADPKYTNIVQHYGNTFEYDFKWFRGASFFFIDGSHSYLAVKNDSEKCFTLAIDSWKPATFIWHDADQNHPGVLQLLDEWRLAERDIRLIHGTKLAFFNIA